MTVSVYMHGETIILKTLSVSNQGHFGFDEFDRDLNQHIYGRV